MSHKNIFLSEKNLGSKIGHFILLKYVGGRNVLEFSPASYSCRSSIDLYLLC